MERYLHTNTSLQIRKWLPALLLMQIVFFSAYAQCPQRYRDRVFTDTKPSLDIGYGGNKLNVDGTYTFLAYDLFEPKDDTAQLRPLVVLIHGGGFTNQIPLNRKSPEIIEIAKDLAKRGYVTASPEYRLFGGETTYDKMLGTVPAAFLDINSFMCYMANSVQHGNPYRIDTSKVFIGGSSAGALLALNFSVFVNDTADLTGEMKRAMNIVTALDRVNPQTILQNKFCGLRPKGLLLISGAMIDTSLIKPVNTPVFLVHGMLDGALPFYEGNALGDPALPKVFGPGIFRNQLERAGIPVEAHIYPDKYHVPVLFPFGDNLLLALQLTLQTGSIFDKPVMDSTQRQMADFCYRLMGSPATDCSVTAVKQNVITGQLNITPNPAAGLFNVQLPKALLYKNVRIIVYNITGQAVYDEAVHTAGNIAIDITGQTRGMYMLTLTVEQADGPYLYADKLMYH
ncbi:MAG: alpha/beta hydrolase fold domain-containing protein [Sphingobacteriales bacterium]|nr:alpha/beta hydrolase fold domain-containing protein [Sphingobacteriales bacterium]